MRVRQLSSGLVFERYAPDARDFVAAGGFVFADPKEPTIAERLAKLPRATLEVLCAAASVPLPSVTPYDPRPQLLAIQRLVPLLERGVITFPVAGETTE